MGSSPSTKQAGHARKEYRGCLGGLIHLFDFNQSSNVRKLLADKKLRPGKEDVQGCNEKPPTSNDSNDDEIPYGYELHKASLPKAPSELPIKALIKQELLKDSEGLPSVVPPLMGPDALHNDAKARQKHLKQFTEGKRSSRRAVPEEKLRHIVKLHDKKAREPHTSNMPAPLSMTENMQASDHENGRFFPFHGHPQEQQLQEFKKEFEAWQRKKVCDNPKKAGRFDEHSSQIAFKQVQDPQNPHEVKPSVSCENISFSKTDVSQERHHDSNELSDAMDFLQSNKDFFARFLQQPTSLISKNLSNQINQPTQVVKQHVYAQQEEEVNHDVISQTQGRQFPDSSRKCRTENHFQELSGEMSMSERQSISESLIGTKESLKYHRCRRHRFTASAVVMAGNSESPTRIVVLKPSPGKVRFIQSSSPAYPTSVKDSSRKKLLQENGADVLESLKEKLGNDCSLKPSHERRSIQVISSEHDKGTLRDPRQIAREIARQARENVARDLVDLGISTTAQDIGRKRSSGRAQHRKHASAGDTGGRRKGEVSVQPKIAEPPKQKLTFSQQDNKFQLASVDKGGDARRIPSELRATSAECPEKLLLQVQNVKLMKARYLEDNCHSAPKSKPSQTSGKHYITGHDGDQHAHLRPNSEEDAHLRTIPPAGGTHPFIRIGEKIKDRGESSRALLRSRSVPTGSTFTDCTMDRVKESKEQDTPNGLVKSAMEKVSQGEAISVRGSLDIVLSSGSMQSLVSRELPGLKDDFSLSKKQATYEEQLEHEVTEESGIRGFSTGASVGESSAQGLSDNQIQIQDSRPLPETESFTSLRDDLGTPETTECMEASVSCYSPITHLLGAELAAAQTHLEEFDDEVQKNLAMIVHSSNGIHNRIFEEVQSNPTCLTGAVAVTPSINGIATQPEHPSPVSVLEVPFEDTFTELDDPNFQDGGMPFGDDFDIKTISDLNLPVQDSCSVSNASTHEDTISFTQFDDRGNASSSNVCLSDPEYPDFDVDYPRGKKLEILYMKNVLINSGFNKDSSLIPSLCMISDQPLDRSLFEEMESGLSDKKASMQVRSCDGSKLGEEGEVSLTSVTRHLLFDSLSEVLVEVLGSYCHRLQYARSLKLFPRPAQRNVFDYVLSKVCHLTSSQTGAQESLENLVTKDLTKEDHWLELYRDEEALGLEVERAIFSDLIEETLLIL